MMTAQDLASRLGLKKYPRSWRGTCPACDYGRVFSVKAGSDHHPLVYCANGCTSDLLLDTLQRCYGDEWKPKPVEVDQDATARRAKSAADALKIWRGSETTLAGTPAARYLASRGLSAIVGSAALRFRGDCYHPEQGRHPALVAAVHDVAGEPVAIHRTYLARDGRKAAVEPPKASKGPIWGGAVRLHPAAPALVIGEGIESSASAGILLDLPAWAAINAGNLARGVILPPAVHDVVIAADRDRAGSQAAHAAAARWRTEGRRVRIAWPDQEGQDFNDVLLAGEAARHAA